MGYPEPENTVDGVPRYSFCFRNSDSDKREWMGMKGTKKKAISSANYLKERYPDAEMIAVLDRKTDEIVYEETFN